MQIADLPGVFLMHSQWKVESVALDRLEQHPRQHEFFIAPTEVQLEELAADLERRGQQEPIHITPGGTLIRGHRRVAAARLLGWKKLKAVVRHDLSDPQSDETVSELINDNIKRQQLDDLALARCYRELKRTAPSRGGASGDVRDQLAAHLNCGKSGRSLDRLERLLRLPRDIQDLITNKQLNKDQGERILRLPKKLQQEVFQALRNAENIPAVLRRFGIIKSTNTRTPAELGEELLRFFNRNLPAVRTNIEALDRLQVRGRDVVELLEDATKFMTAWTDRKRELKQQDIKEIQSIIKHRSKPDNLSGGAR